MNFICAKDVWPKDELVLQAQRKLMVLSSNRNSTFTYPKLPWLLYLSAELENRQKFSLEISLLKKVPKYICAAISLAVTHIYVCD